MLKDIIKYNEKQEKSIIYEKRGKLLYKYGSSKNIYNLCNLTNFKVFRQLFR